jgi:hypothetical protein
VGIILTAITGVLTPALSIPLAAVAVLLLGCVKVTDTYKSVNWRAVATVGGMMSVGLALEKTGAAGALAHARLPPMHDGRARSGSKSRARSSRMSNFQSAMKSYS